MTIKQIKLGSWVETGTINVKPRDVLRQLSHDESKALDDQFAEQHEEIPT